MKDKAFFFVNGDLQRRETPNGFSIGGSTGQDFGHQAEAQRFESILQTPLRLRPGALQRGVHPEHRQRQGLRARWTSTWRPTTASRCATTTSTASTTSTAPSNSSTTFNYPDHVYQFNSKTNSTVAQLNSTFGSRVQRAAPDLPAHPRGPRHPSPTSRRSRWTCADGTRLLAGTEQFSAANALDQDIFELTDDFTFTRGNHTHHGRHPQRVLQVQEPLHPRQLRHLPLLEPRQLRGRASPSSTTTASPRPPTRSRPREFKVNQLGFYVGDVWRVNPAAHADPGRAPRQAVLPRQADRQPGRRRRPSASPRTWCPTRPCSRPAPASTGTSRATASGSCAAASGIFSGRTPYVWLSNQYGNTGIEFQRIGAGFNANNRIPFVTDPFNQPKTVTGATAGTFTNEIDLDRPRLQVSRGPARQPRLRPRPRLLGLIGTVEFFGATTLKDIAYNNLNRIPGPTTLFDGRPIFVRKVPSLSDAVLLTNTDEGSQWSVSGKLERPFRERAVRQRLVPLRPLQVDQRRHLEPGALQLALRLRAGRHQQPAAGLLELRRRQPHQPRGLLRAEGAERTCTRSCRCSTTASPAGPTRCCSTPT